MNQSQISVRYAKALYMASENSNKLTEVSADLKKILDLYHSSEDFILFLQSSVIKISQKISILNDIFIEHVQPLTMRFLILLAENRREAKLPDISRVFNDLVMEKLGVESVIITTAADLNPEVRENINRYLQLKTGKTIELTEKIKPEIIGGLILRIGDLQYDGSIAKQLKNVKEALLDSELFDIRN
jgi:F-type H+-transporting ATPase subunit delta